MSKGNVPMYDTCQTPGGGGGGVEVALCKLMFLILGRKAHALVVIVAEGKHEIFGVHSFYFVRHTFRSAFDTHFVQLMVAVTKKIQKGQQAIESAAETSERCQAASSPLYSTTETCSLSGAVSDCSRCYANKRCACV